jgi:hypothetical protein
VWSGELDGWGDGLCGDCLPRFPLGETWSIYEAGNTPLQSYSKCQHCLTSDLPYAVWGMCEGCYQDWQDKFIEPDNLYDFVEEYGPLAALLIRSSAEWINYMKETLSHKYCWNAGNKSFPHDAELVPFKPKLPGRQVKTLKDINIDLEALIHGNDSIRTSKG